MSEQDLTPEDAVQIAQRALAKIGDLEDTIEEQNQTIEHMQERIFALENRLPENRDYDSLTKQEKIGMVREHVVQRAREQGGVATVDYDDVIWGPFDGEPSASHCYTLMRKAAEADGFRFEDPEHANKRLSVNLDETKDLLGFSHAKKDAATEVL